MLTSQKITAADGVHFTAVDALYDKAFPWHEQREPAAKRQALRDPRYLLEAWFDDGVFIGLSGCWQFAGYRYIEHLAIDDTLRSRGYGKRLLAGLLQRTPLTILEIDPLTTEIAHKRLRFYATMGFCANPWPHRHPTYHRGIADHELIVLSYPQAIDASQYRRFAGDLRQVVMAGVGL
ncbi:GNAT family N-acetyltransferase [Klebsiella sp. NPDC088457]